MQHCEHRRMILLILLVLELVVKRFGLLINFYVNRNAIITILYERTEIELIFQDWFSALYDDSRFLWHQLLRLETDVIEFIEFVMQIG